MNWTKDKRLQFLTGSNIIENSLFLHVTNVVLANLSELNYIWEYFLFEDTIIVCIEHYKFKNDYLLIYLLLNNTSAEGL